MDWGTGERNVRTVDSNRTGASKLIVIVALVTPISDCHQVVKSPSLINCTSWDKVGSLEEHSAQGSMSWNMQKTLGGSPQVEEAEKLRKRARSPTGEKHPTSTGHTAMVSVIMQTKGSRRRHSIRSILQREEGSRRERDLQDATCLDRRTCSLEVLNMNRIGMERPPSL